MQFTLAYSKRRLKDQISAKPDRKVGLFCGEQRILESASRVHYERCWLRSLVVTTTSDF